MDLCPRLFDGNRQRQAEHKTFDRAQRIAAVLQVAEVMLECAGRGYDAVHERGIPRAARYQGGGENCDHGDLPHHPTPKTSIPAQALASLSNSLRRLLETWGASSIRIC